MISNATPISIPDPAAPTAEIAQWATTAASERLRVLLVDDDPGDARLTLEKLSDAGGGVDCQVVTTLQEASGDRLAGIHCVLIEPGSPDATGHALRTLRARAPEMPVVVLTRIEDPDTAAHSLRLGAQEHLIKTHADGPTLSRAIRFAVVRQRLQDEQRRQSTNDLELHDDIIQHLFAIGLAMQTTQQRSAGEPRLATESTTTSTDCTTSSSWCAAPWTPNSSSEVPARATSPAAGDPSPPGATRARSRRRRRSGYDHGLARRGVHRILIQVGTTVLGDHDDSRSAPTRSRTTRNRCARPKHCSTAKN